MKKKKGSKVCKRTDYSKMKGKRPIIEVNDAYKIYKMGDVEVQALRGLNLNVYRGEFVSIEGPSGSGKSTAMNIIGCLDYPTRGSVLLDGKDITELTESQLAQIRGKKIGFVFQQFNLINTLTALENVTLPMVFQDMNREDRIRYAISLLDQVGLGDRKNHKPTELSGGQQQRVAIARALSNDPEVVLADEPTGNLDTKTGDTVMDFLLELKKKGKTIIMVTHNPALSKFADRVEYLRDGQICSSK